MHRYLLAKARNTRTKQTVKSQDLTGARFTVEQRSLCQAAADTLARNMSSRTGDLWQGYCEPYTPSQRRA